MRRRLAVILVLALLSLVACRSAAPGASEALWDQAIWDQAAWK